MIENALVVLTFNYFLLSVANLLNYLCSACGNWSKDLFWTEPFFCFNAHHILLKWHGIFPLTCIMFIPLPVKDVVVDVKRLVHCRITENVAPFLEW